MRHIQAQFSTGLLNRATLRCQTSLTFTLQIQEHLTHKPASKVSLDPDGHASGSRDHRCTSGPNPPSQLIPHHKTSHCQRS